MRVSQIVTFLTTLAGVIAAPLESRAVINHDAVVGFAQAVPSGSLGAALLKFKPYLYIVNGCVPFPAVDSAGNTGGGLATSGSSNGGCSSSTGQVYARAVQYGNYYALMYSWYMPKDSPSDGLGHRHDWEGIVVWIDNLTSQTIKGLATSAHGDFDVITSDFPLDGTRPKIRYYSVWPVNHQLGTTSTKGGEQPLIYWDNLTSAARTALTNTDFGDAIVPFKDSTFTANLAKAAI
ncbi:npp1 domain-containing protein [Truncatella angustata]|uniref:Npp1 domain-containing protein n=1 Tax=Truncatella angustata TaxID=152316 RepID=A0A9P8ZWF3_9PEZI|nr:npp1 domain-containing protein [Truncatella angustata]KAH6652907.1 npp1 domain-containing protein [Truncatella angustata]